MAESVSSAANQSAVRNICLRSGFSIPSEGGQKEEDRLSSMELRANLPTPGSLRLPVVNAFRPLDKNCQDFPPQTKVMTPESNPLPRQNSPKTLAGFTPGLGILKIERKIQKRPLPPPGERPFPFRGESSCRSKQPNTSSHPKPIAAATSKPTAPAAPRPHSTAESSASTTTAASRWPAAGSALPPPQPSTWCPSSTSSGPKTTTPSSSISMRSPKPSRAASSIPARPAP